MRGRGLDSFGLGQEIVTGCCEYCYGPSGFINRRVLLPSEGFSSVECLGNMQHNSGGACFRTGKKRVFFCVQGTNKLTQRVALVICIWEVLGSNLGPDIGLS
jgi:hypothetical protein